VFTLPILSHLFIDFSPFSHKARLLINMDIFRYSVGVITSAFHAENPGSIPGIGDGSLEQLLFVPLLVSVLFFSGESSCMV
jgi:hypothetical protein